MPTALVVGCALRFFRLGSASLWSDEAFSYDVARLPFGHLRDLWNLTPPAGSPGWQAGSILHVVATADAHPPLFYFLLREWMKLVAPNATPPAEWVLRFPCAVCSCVALYFFACLATRLLSQDGAVMAILFAATAQASIWAAQEARMYPLLSALVLGAAWSGVRAWLDDWRPGWVLFVILSIGAAYTQYLGLFSVVAFLLWTFTVAPRTRASRRTRFLAITCVALAFAPWMPVLAHQLATGQARGDVRGITRSRILPSLAATAVETTWGPSFPLRETASPTAYALLGLATLLLLASGVYTLGRWRPVRNADPPVGPQPCAARSLALLEVALPTGGLALSGLLGGHTPFQPRFFMYLAPFAALALAAVTMRPRLGPILLALLLGANCVSLYDWYFVPAWQRQPVRQLVSALEARTKPGDLVLVEQRFAEPAVLYYLRAPDVTVEPASPDMVKDGTLARLTRSHPSVWLLLLSPWTGDPDHRVADWLGSHAQEDDTVIVPSYEPAYNGVLLHFRMCVAPPGT